MKNNLALLGAFWLLVIFHDNALAMERKALCLVCGEHHLDVRDDPIDVDSVFVAIELDILEQLARLFPCLASELMTLKTGYYVPPVKHDTFFVPKHRHSPLTIGPEQLLVLAFLATIHPGNFSIPLLYDDAVFFEDELSWQEHTKAWLGGRALLFFLLFSTGGALANFFTFINIYYPANNETNSTEIDATGSMLIQDSLLALGTGIFSFLGSAASLVWTGLNQDALRSMTNKFHKITHRIHDEYLELARALIVLYFYIPEAANKIAHSLDEKTIAVRIKHCVGDELSYEIIGASNLFAAAEFVRSQGQHLPKSLELQLFIFSLSNFKY